MAGNFCGAALAYFGADVIKVEPPGTGDALRSLRTADKSGNSLWWRSYVSVAMVAYLNVDSAAVDKAWSTVAL